MNLVDLVVSNIVLLLAWLDALLSNWVYVPANVADPLAAASLTPFGTDYVAQLASLAMAWSGSLVVAFETMI